MKSSTKTRVAAVLVGGGCIGIVSQLLGEGRHLLTAAILLCTGIVCLAWATAS